MKWVNKPSKEVLATSARMHQKICVIIICATKPCQPVACSQKAISVKIMASREEVKK